MFIINFIKDFEDFTGLKLQDCYDGKYRECSGVSYKKILNKVKEYNNKQNLKYVHTYNDNMEDATFLIFYTRT